ncbi:MAG: glycosyltransferase [Desulfurococcus sp.]|uniref:glycosyltransferase n=1 Tax=Desulfurococcus sp. TaxID=51678 RepID=UPI00316A6416
MKILILHPLLEIGGGAEKLAIEMHRALLELGFDSEIVTFNFDVERAEEAVKLLSPDFSPRIVNVSSWLLRVTDSTLRAVSRNRMTKLRRALLTGFLIDSIMKNKDDILIDTSSHIPTNTHIAYVHVPLVMPSGRSGVVWRTYEAFLRKIADSLTGNPRLVLTNSSWTKRVFMKVYGSRFRVEVLHPPVDVEYFESTNDLREKMIITVSRFSPEKKLEEILKVAVELKDYQFYIVGSATKEGFKLASQLAEKAEIMGLGNVYIITNISREKLRELFHRALFYLHPPYPEHFGLSVAEAIAAGAIPIVYKDGGAWTDIVSHIDPALGYYSVSEISGIVRRIEKNEALVKTIREKGLEVVKSFTFEAFKNKLKQFLHICCLQ